MIDVIWVKALPRLKSPHFERSLSHSGLDDATTSRGRYLSAARVSETRGKDKIQPRDS